MPPLVFRFTSKVEAAEDLRQPQFDECVTPLLVYVQQFYNYDDYLLRGVTTLYR